jgi:hypothetical protein
MKGAGCKGTQCDRAIIPIPTLENKHGALQIAAGQESAAHFFHREETKSKWEDT